MHPISPSSSSSHDSLPSSSGLTQQPLDKDVSEIAQPAIQQQSQSKGQDFKLSRLQRTEASKLATGKVRGALPGMKPSLRATLMGEQVTFTQVGQGKAKNVYVMPEDPDHVYITLTSPAKIAEVKKEVSISHTIETRLYNRFVENIVRSAVKMAHEKKLFEQYNCGDNEIEVIIKEIKLKYPTKIALKEFLTKGSDEFLSEKLCPNILSSIILTVCSKEINDLGAYTATDYEELSGDRAITHEHKEVAARRWVRNKSTEGKGSGSGDDSGDLWDDSKITKESKYTLKAGKADMDLTKLLFDPEKHIDFNQALSIGFDVLAGIRDMHIAGFVHGDIKPDNFLLVNGHAKAADFGKSQEITPNKVLTYGGNPRYIAPEVGLSKSSEAYSVGLVLCQIFDSLRKPTSPKEKEKALKSEELGVEEKADFTGLVKLVQEDQGCIQTHVKSKYIPMFYVKKNLPLMSRDTLISTTNLTTGIYVSDLFEQLKEQGIANERKLDQLQDVIIRLLNANPDNRMSIDEACNLYKECLP